VPGYSPCDRLVVAIFTGWFDQLAHTSQQVQQQVQQQVKEVLT
jgi:hypothetical protein